MRDPTAELLQAMAGDDLHPKQIIWDSQFHRFPGVGQKKGDNGFYKAFVDQRGAIYGDNRTKLRRKWTMKGLKPLTDEERKVIEQRKKDMEKQAKKDAIAAQKRVDELWAKAEPCENHPYLEKKGLKDVPGLKSVPDKDTGEPILLIPMYSIDQKLENIQRIWPSGKRRQSKGVRRPGLFNTIGALAPKGYSKTKRIHVCEGWATGWTIHLATEGTVAVAFFDGGLKTVAVALRKKYPDAHIWICTDNDRWSKVWRGEKKVANPGVIAGREAVKAAKAKLCIPDFEDLEGKPTDYDDLRQREGHAAVRKWLSPKRAAEAVTIMEPEPGEPAPEIEEEEEDDGVGHWSEHAPFRCLGAIGKTHYFIPNDFGQLITLAQREMTTNGLLALARLSWFKERWPIESGRNKGKPDWTLIVDAIVAHSRSLGPYQPSRLCGRGFWREEDELVIHLGDRLLPPGKKAFIDPSNYTPGSGKIYVKLPRLDGPHPKRVLPLDKGTWLMGVFEDLLWEYPVSAYLLAGWVVLAPFSGYLRWRPHVWLTGDAGCGKTTILRELVVPLTAGVSLYAEGSQTTEAGLRQELASDALPVILDEPEKDQNAAVQRVKAIIRMMRSASATAAKIYKGTPSGKGLSWESRSMFCLGSVGGSVGGQQDKQRISLLQLRHPRIFGDVAKQEEHYRSLLNRFVRITPNLARQLLGRTTEWARTGKLDRLLETSIAAATTILGDRRHGDQYGTLLAGAYLLQNDDIPAGEEMVAWMKDLAIHHLVDIEGTEPEGQNLLEELFQVQETVLTQNGNFKVTVGEMVSLVIENPALMRESGRISCADAKKYLRDIGFRVEGGHLYVANQSTWIRKQVGTAYKHGWHNLLRSMPGAEEGKMMWFTSYSSRTTMIPCACMPREPVDHTPAFIPPDD